ncbi:MAG: glycerol-3-phosphate acyltransferase [Giesbergeria sp.]
MPLFATAAVLLSYLLGCLNAGYYYGQTGSPAGHTAWRGVAQRAPAMQGACSESAPLRWCFWGTPPRVRLATGVGLSLGPESGALCAVAVVLGHIWPVQLGFRGGKGIASALGSLLLLAPWLLALMAVDLQRLLKSIGQSSSHAGIAAFWVGAAGSALLYGRRASRGHGRAGTAAYHQPPYESCKDVVSP